MVVLRALLLWGVVSVHVVGAAFLFRRFFPRESRWLGFIVPEIVFVLLCNFIEHHVALTLLRFLLPVTTFASVVFIFGPRSPWRIMRLPTLLFLGTFFFALFLRTLRPDIEDCRDGIPDLSLISSFTFGQTLPVESTWLPPVRLLHYYFLEHYGASLVTRLLGVDIGTGFNLSCALLSAYILFLSAAVGWHLSRGKLWVAILMPVMTACATTGDSAYLWLTHNELDPENIINPYSLLDDPSTKNDWYIRHLTPIYLWDRHELMPPGYGAWMGSFHSTQAGQVAICFCLLALVELLRRKKTNWPWICLALSPFLMLTTCTWGVPLIGFLLMAGLIACLRSKIVPESLSKVLATSAGLIVLLEPMLSYFLNWHPPHIYSSATGLHTELLEFIAQWWPIFLPWLALCFIWKNLSAAARIVLISTPLALAGVELWNFGERSDMTAKSWGIIYTAAWIVLLPELARQRVWMFRTIFASLVIASALSLCFWTGYYHRVVNSENFGQLDGQGQFRLDRRKARIMEVLSHLDNQVIIPGKSAWATSESALVTQLTHNRAYSGWSLISDSIFYSNAIAESYRREIAINLLYQGKNPNPLYYLRQRDIAALVIFPDDQIDLKVVDQLKQNLAPYYSYEDANFRTQEQLESDVSTKVPPAGVFIYHPELTTFLGPVKDDGK